MYKNAEKENRKSSVDNSHRIFCLGNGKLCVYMDGINIHQIFGPLLSTPSYMHTEWEGPEEIRIVTKRKAETGIWMHGLTDWTDKMLGIIYDFVTEDMPCFIRICELKCEIRFRITVEPGWKTVMNSERFDRADIGLGFLAYADAGISVYDQAHYPCIHDLAHQFLVCGPAHLKEEGLLVLSPGKTVWYSVGGSDYPECIVNTEKILRERPEKLLENVEKSWRIRLNEDIREKILSSSLPSGKRLVQAVENTAVLILSQQSEEGAVIAGHNFHMAYVRDQLGVARGLLKMGYIREVRAILNFYQQIFSRYGCIHNAQTIGTSHYFHVHENDNVEITGYLIIQAFDYYKASHDMEFMRGLIPMLEWAWNAQVSQIHEKMLPFNGDETYIAGHILSRDALWDGSAEATLLFIASGERLLPFMLQHGYWNSEKYEKNRAVFLEVRHFYKKNFVVDGRLMANRIFQEPYPKKRFGKGVCSRCLTYGWIEQEPDGQYVCCECYGKGAGIRKKRRAVEVQSVQLMPLFIGTDLFSVSELEEMILLSAESPAQKKFTGYDLGLLLVNILETAPSLAETIYDKLLDSEDEMGGWSEFYVNGVPGGTYCRPWESGINVYAMIKYAQRFWK
ncbi:hypothetical protein B5F07_03860 [Lachnoclostridium sp. An169]|uniref:hypothetical protein n=1 Tax=Lachnoclostridium sp. An169 TaxID=1965569 RepID=UPI000B39995D|nr:hypothetical protein [Lachnoclostridium sp. An169]OUP85808.1 hypothetical protein B5F07_03860 [Lachnoclostridium sp. An169]